MDRIKLHFELYKNHNSINIYFNEDGIDMPFFYKKHYGKF